MPFADFIQAAIAKLRPGYRGELEHQTAAKMAWRPKPLQKKVVVPTRKLEHQMSATEPFLLLRPAAITRNRNIYEVEK